MPITLITGAGRGIGKVIAIELAKNGYDVIVTARHMKGLTETANEIKKLGRKVICIKANLENKKEITELIKKSIRKFKRVDLLINNAGVAYGGDFSDNNESEIEKTINVNLRGLILCTKAILPYMLKQKSGIIINISSVVGKHGHPGLAVYSATKFGVIGFTEALAQEIEKNGIKAFTVCPDGTNTKMYWDLFHNKAKFDSIDVALEILHLLKNINKIPVGSAINVKKY